MPAKLSNNSTLLILPKLQLGVRDGRSDPGQMFQRFIVQNGHAAVSIRPIVRRCHTTITPAYEILSIFTVPIHASRRLSCNRSNIRPRLGIERARQMMRIIYDQAMGRDSERSNPCTVPRAKRGGGTLNEPTIRI